MVFEAGGDASAAPSVEEMRRMRRATLMNWTANRRKMAVLTLLTFVAMC
jgi:hypothetical protein